MKNLKSTIRIWLLAMLVLPTALMAATINGTVTTTTGTPIAGAKVVAIVGGVRVDSAITSATGQYTLINVAVGGTILQASAVGYTNGNQFVNVIAAGGTYTANFALTATLGGATGTVSGTVLQIGTLTPIAGAMVRLFNVASGFLDTAFTDSLGRYSFTLVPAAGGYSIVVTHPGHNTQLRNAIAVTANTTSTQNFTLQITAKITGTVTNSTNSNAIAGAMVILTLPSVPAFVPETTFTTALGAYSFDSVSNGNQYLITVSATGFQTATNNTVTITDARRSGIADFSLVPVTGGNTGSITGLISSANSGVPIAGARVILSRGGGFADTVFTNASGQYRFDSVPVQNGYTVTASAALFTQNQRINIAVVLGQTTVVDITLLSATRVLAFTGSFDAYEAKWNGGTLNLRMCPSARVRNVEAYSPNGSLLQIVTVRPGQSKVVFPKKMPAGALLRVR